MFTLGDLVAKYFNAHLLHLLVMAAKNQSQFGQISTILNKSKACNFIKKETLTQVLSCEFCEAFKNIFLTVT